MHVKIRPFQEGDRAAFERLNVAWIEKHFELESQDRLVLSNPKHHLIGDDGEVLIAELRFVVVGCCALTPHGTQSVELSKMAVEEEYRGQGIGEQLLRRAIEWTRANGFGRLYLETSYKLPAAIRLYERCGFQPVPPERALTSAYQRVDVQMELWV